MLLGGEDAWGSARNDVWVVGSGGIFHWDGTFWSLSTTGVTGAVLYGISGKSSNDIWVVGQFGTILHRQYPPASFGPWEPSSINNDLRLVRPCYAPLVMSSHPLLRLL